MRFLRRTPRLEVVCRDFQDWDETYPVRVTEGPLKGVRIYDLATDYLLLIAESGSETSAPTATEARAELFRRKAEALISSTSARLEKLHGSASPEKRLLMEKLIYLRRWADPSVVLA